MAWTNPTANPPSSSSGAALSYYNGNVGIGTTTPSVKLSVVGDLTVSGTSTLSGNVIGAFTNFQVFDLSGSFNTTGKSKLMVEVWGGGGGGGGSKSGAGDGTDGGITLVSAGSTLISATGGGKGIGGGIAYFGGAGGTSAAAFNLQGKRGSGVNVAYNNAYQQGFGGDSPRGGEGGVCPTAVVNICGIGQAPGGGGSGSVLFNPTNTSYSGTSGGGGGYGMEIFTGGINYTIGNSLTITIGVGGVGGAAGTSGDPGAAGAAGRVVIWW